MNRKAYPSDLTDAEWELLEPLIPPEKPGGQHRKVDMREIANAMFYLLRNGCSWRSLPHDFPPWSTVSGYFYRWQRLGVWADQGYQGQLEVSAPIVCGWTLQIVKRTEPGFKILPRRWVVERTLAWLGRERRLSKDYEQLPEVSEDECLCLYGASYAAPFSDRARLHLTLQTPSKPE